MAEKLNQKQDGRDGTEDGNADHDAIRNDPWKQQTEQSESDKHGGNGQLHFFAHFHTAIVPFLPRFPSGKAPKNSESHFLLKTKGVRYRFQIACNIR